MLDASSPQQRQLSLKVFVQVPFFVFFFCILNELSQDYEECFLEMTNLPRYQNVASRMFAGHYAYDGDVRLCLREDSEDCDETLESVLAGTCNLNFIIMT